MFILKLLSMRIALFLLLLSIINLTSCKDSHQKQSNEIKVEFGESDNYIEASTIFEKDYQASLLENPIKESSVGGIDRVLFADDKIVIVDRMANKLVLFGNDGKYITSTFNMVGQGANEYVHLSDATLDENEKKIYLYCDAPYQIMVFDYNLKFERIIKLDFLAFEIAVSGDYIYLTRHNTDTGALFDLYCLSKLHPKQEPTLILKGVPGAKGVRGIGKSLIASGDDVYLSFPFDNKIHRLKNGKVVDTYTFDFGSKSIVDEDIKGMSSRQFISEYGKHIWSLSNICATDSHLYFTSSSSPGIFIFDIKENKCIAYNDFFNDILPVFSSLTIPSQGKPGHFVYNSSQRMVEDYLNYLQEHPEVEHNSTVINILEQYDEDSNPLIVPWKIK